MPLVDAGRDRNACGHRTSGTRTAHTDSNCGHSCDVANVLLDELSDVITGIGDVMPFTARKPAESQRVRSVEWIIVREDVGLVGRRDLRIDAQELIGRWVVIAVDSAFSRKNVDAGERNRLVQGRWRPR